MEPPFARKSLVWKRSPAEFGLLQGNDESSHPTIDISTFLGRKLAISSLHFIFDICRWGTDS